jgi:hypothetical protein
MNPQKQTMHALAKNCALVLIGLLAATSVQPSAASVGATPNAGLQMGGRASDGGINSTSDMPASSTWTYCTPDQVMTYTESRRVHVHCTAAVSGISYFATGTGDAANAARVLSVITTAQVAGRTLSILYDPADLSGSAIGCGNSDCRLILAVGFGP